jgi:hypothetical protein
MKRYLWKVIVDGRFVGGYHAFARPLTREEAEAALGRPLAANEVLVPCRI